MDTIYKDFTDTNVAVRKVYAKTDGYAYADIECKTKISADDLHNIYTPVLLCFPVHSLFSIIFYI